MIDGRNRGPFVPALEAVVAAVENPPPRPKERYDFFDEWPHPVLTDDHGYDDAEAYAQDGLDDDGFDGA